MSEDLLKTNKWHNLKIMNIDAHNVDLYRKYGHLFCSNSTHFPAFSRISFKFKPCRAFAHEE